MGIHFVKLRFVCTKKLLFNNTKIVIVCVPVRSEATSLLTLVDPSQGQGVVLRLMFAMFVKKKVSIPLRRTFSMQAFRVPVWR